MKSVKHTGRILPRASTSYPLLAMIMLLVGVLIINWSGVVSAGFPGPVTNDYTVSTRYPAPLPTQSATIGSPIAGQKFSTKPINVSGSCPINSYVELMRNGVFSGVALCDVNGRYQLSTDLFSGANKLLPQVYNVTGDAGPSGTPITVYYQPEAAPSLAGSTNSTGTSSPGSTPVLPLLLKTDFVYQGFYTGQSVQWQLEVSDGAGPYAISADWGDGSNDLLSVAQPGGFVMRHTYKKPGAYRGSYPVTFSAIDISGNKTILQLLSIINTPNPKSAAGLQICLNNGDCKSNGQIVSGGIRNIVWSGYGVSVLMLISFWLGERHELHFLSPRRKRAGHA